MNPKTTVVSCLVCGRPDYIEDCHWPEAVGNRKRKNHPELPTVPMCIFCHRDQHHGAEWVVDILIRKAPVYWKARDEWEQAKPYYEWYLSRREYIEDTQGGDNG